MDAKPYDGALGARAFIRNMDAIAHGLLLARTTTDHIYDAELERLKATIDRSESLAFVLIPGCDYRNAIERLNVQRALIAALETIRKLIPITLEDVDMPEIDK